MTTSPPSRADLDVPRELLPALSRRGEGPLGLLVVALVVSCARPAPEPPAYCGTALYQRHAATDGADACDRGDLEACLAAGDAYEHGGYFVPTSRAIAGGFYLRACEGGAARGCEELARLLGEERCDGDHTPRCAERLEREQS